MSLRNKVLAGLKWTIIGRVVSQIVTWGITIYVMRILTPGDYGLIALAGMFNALLMLLSEMGLGTAVVQSKELPAERMRQLFGLVLVTNFGACVLMAAVLAPLSAFIFDDSHLILVVQVIALGFIPVAFTVIPGALLARELNFRSRAFADVTANTLGGVMTLLLAYANYGALAIAWGGVAQSIVRAAAYLALSPRVGSPSFNFSGCGILFNFGRNVAQTQLAWYFYSQADTFLIGKLLGRHELGIYSVSMELASLPASRVSSILNQVVTPALASVNREGGSVGPYVNRTVRGLMLISVPLMWGLSALSEEFVHLVLGPKWSDAAVPLAMLCLIMPLRMLSPVAHAALYAVGRADLSFRQTWMTALTMCGAFLIGVNFSILGMALAWVIAFPLVFLIGFLWLHPLLGMNRSETALILLRPAAAAGLMCGAIDVLRPLFTWHPVANLAGLITLGALVYVAMTLLFNRYALAEVMDMFWHKKNG